MRRLLCLACLFLAMPTIGQEPDGLYFALTSNRTFSPGEQPQVLMWAQGVKALDFRLYRIEQAGEFLSQLRDAHSFGNQTSTLPREETPLYRLARWKRRWRDETRHFVRNQFSAAARQQWNARPGAEGKTAQKAAKGTAYASVPVLNEKQLLRSWRETVRGRERWEEQPVGIPVAEPGLYLVEATDGKLRAYTLVSVSTMAVVTKTQPGLMLARVVDRTTGQGLAGVDVEFRSYARKHLAAKTDVNGFARLEGKDSTDIFVIARKQRDVAFDAVSDFAINPEAEQRLLVYALTDRPVYRPGHVVHYKATLREPKPFGYAIPKIESVQAEVLDQEGKSIHQKSLPVSRFGSVQGEFSVPLTASLGYYSIKFSTGRRESYASFQVEEYRKPEYEVRIQPTAPRVVQGERVSATVSARYYFGEPVRNAKVVYTVRRAPYYPPWYERDEMGYQATEEDSSGGEFFDGPQGEEKTARLDDKGELSIALPTPVVDRDYLFRIEARVMDEGNREVTGYGLVIATRGSYQARVRSQRYVVSPGETGVFEIDLLDYDNRPVQAAWRAELLRVEYAGGRARTTLLESTAGQTGPEGKARASFRLAAAGSYRVRVSSRTPEGRDVSDEEYLWVSGSGASFGGEEETIRMIPDKKSYSAGETAKILILTKQADTDIWVSTESRTIIDSRPVRARAAGGVTVEVPIRAEYQPRVFFSAVYLKGNQLYQGSVALKVPPVDKEVDLAISTDKAEYKPGEPVQLAVVARDRRGRPVEAELSLGVVDEALYAVRKDTTETPLSFFYGNFYNEVASSNSLSYYFRGEAGKRAMRLARIRPSLGQLKPERVGDPRVRKAFPDTAFWKADLLTDAEGRARVSFAFPDALTMWRTTARAVSADTRVGAAMHRVTVRKNLLLRSALPRFLREGDEVGLGFVVQNYLTQAKKVKVSLGAPGLELLESAEKYVTLASKASARVEFRVRVKAGTESTITAKAITDEESDAIEVSLPIEGYGTLLSQGASGVLVDAQSASAQLDAPGDGRRSVQVRIAPSLAGSLLASLEYLTRFPYGCTEQTLSSFVPNVIVGQTLDALRIKTKVNRAELGEKVRQGLERLYDYQHEDGAWGWWKNDASDPFMTAHVVAGLKQARAAGYGVVPEALRRGEVWLRSEFQRQRDARVDLRAYIAYALGGKDDVEAVWAQRARMSVYGLAFLGLTLDGLQDPRAVEVAQSIESQARQSADEAWWPSDRDPLLDFAGDTTAETTAHIVKLLSRTRKNSPLLAKAVLWLVRHKDQGAWWNSTKQTAMVIYGITDYLRESGEMEPDLSVTVTLNGKEIFERALTAADVSTVEDIVVSVPAAERNALSIRSRGRGKVYWNAQASYYSTAENLRPSVTIERTYYRLAPREAAGETTYSLEPLAGEIRPGDTIAALLRVTAPGARYVLIEDPIAAGMELVNNENRFNISGRPTWWNYSWSQREFRDNRVAFFRTAMPEKPMEFFYVMKAVHGGKFRIPPPRLQPMYQPGELANGRASRLEVIP